MNVLGTIVKERQPIDQDWYDKMPEGDILANMKNPLAAITKIKGRVK